MAPSSRLPPLILLGIFIPIYLVFLANQGLLIQLAGAVVLLLLLASLIFSGVKIEQSPSKTTESHFVDSIDDVELPAPVHPENESPANADIIRSRGRSPKKPEIPIPEPEPQISINDEDEPELIATASGLAERYVAGSDPESIMEIEIDNFLSVKRQQKMEIAERIRRNKRIESSKRAAIEAAKWTESEDGEDIGSLLKEPDHKQVILTEPENPSSTAPQGISYVRIDEDRVLKVRVPLDVPRRTNPTLDGGDDESPDSSPPPPMPGLPPPPGPNISGIPPPVDPKE